MISYYCIINIPGVPCREIVVVSATDDATATRETAQLARSWPGYETISLYQGERPVTVLANTSLGFATGPLEVLTRAA